VQLVLQRHLEPRLHPHLSAATAPVAQSALRRAGVHSLPQRVLCVAEALRYPGPSSPAARRPPGRVRRSRGRVRLSTAAARAGVRRRGAWGYDVGTSMYIV
jgi:hypothetical protein